METRIKLAKNGGYRHGSGHGKHGVYKGYQCDSSWELAYVIYNLEHDIKFERNRDRFLYNLNGKSHYYTPDFICDGEINTGHTKTGYGPTKTSKGRNDIRFLFWGNRATNRFLTTYWVVGKWYASTLLMCQFPGVRIPPSQLKNGGARDWRLKRS